MPNENAATSKAVKFTLVDQQKSRHKKAAPKGGVFMISLQRYEDMFLIRFGSDLLSHALRRSTISAAALNCRVRDGIGCFARAMTTKSKKEHIFQAKHANRVYCVCF